MATSRTKSLPFSVLKAVAAAFFLLCCAALARGEDGKGLSIQDAVRLALENNPEILAARAGAEGSRHMVSAARSGLMPRVDISETFQNTTVPMWAFGTKLNQGAITAQGFNPSLLNDPDDISNFNTTVSLRWPLYDGGRTLAEFSRAKLERDAGLLALKKVEQDVMSKTAQAYIGVLLAEENLKVVEKALETARAHMETVESRFSKGLVVKSDLLRAQVRIAELEQQRLDAKSRVEIAMAALNTVMGQPMESSFSLSTPFGDCAGMEGNEQTWIKKALSSRPDLKRLELQVQMAEKEIDMAQSGHLPQVFLNGDYQVNSESFDGSSDSYTVGATVQLNLFAGNGISARARAAEAKLESVKAMYEALRNGIRLQVRQEYLSAKSALQRIDVAQSAVSQAEENLRIVGNRYQNGLLTIVDLLDAQVADQKARSLLFQAIHDYKVARIRLAAAAGIMDCNLK